MFSSSNKSGPQSKTSVPNTRKTNASKLHEPSKAYNKLEQDQSARARNNPFEFADANEDVDEYHSEDEDEDEYQYKDEYQDETVEDMLRSLKTEASEDELPPEQVGQEPPLPARTTPILAPAANTVPRSILSRSEKRDIILARAQANPQDVQAQQLAAKEQKRRQVKKERAKRYKENRKGKRQAAKAERRLAAQKRDADALAFVAAQQK